MAQAGVVLAQPASPPPSPPPPKPSQIQDNSFLLEEAYNQESGVVQHISGWTRPLSGKGWVYTFTQEWPAPSIRHQFSYTVPALLASDPAARVGIGDVALSYRRQLIGDGAARFALSPRLSLLLPTGDERMGRGAGGLGFQVNIPASLVLSPAVVAHSNAGVTHVPNSRNPAGAIARASGFNLGQSLVWLAHPNFNVMLEAVYARSQAVVGKDTTEPVETLLISPGIRWAFNFKNGLQIVPGLAFPIGLGPSRGEHDLLVYLSFEHPFRRAR